MVDESSTAPSGQFKALSAGGRRIFHRGPQLFKGFPRAVDESSAAYPSQLSGAKHEKWIFFQAAWRPRSRSRRHEATTRALSLPWRTSTTTHPPYPSIWTAPSSPTCRSAASTNLHVNVENECYFHRSGFHLYVVQKLPNKFGLCICWKCDAA